jgi:hypothetical protein
VLAPGGGEPQARRKFVSAEVRRGLTTTAALLGALWLLHRLFEETGEEPLTDGAFTIQPHWAAIAIVAAVIGIALVLWYFVRGWQWRPRWLVPVGAIVLGAAGVLAANPFTPIDHSYLVCVPLVDAWHPVVPRPNTSDVRVFNSTFASPSTVQSAAEFREFRVASNAARHTPAFKRVTTYLDWSVSKDACTPRARRYLAASAATLVTGAAGTIVGVGRSRRRRQLSRR